MHGTNMKVLTVFIQERMYATVNKQPYLLTPWCRVLLEQLTGLQLVKKFPAFHRNPKVHYHTHKRPPPVPILGQPNPVHIPTSHLLEIHPNIIDPSMPRTPQWSLSLRFPHQDSIHPPLLTHTCHMPSPSHSYILPTHCIYVYCVDLRTNSDYFPIYYHLTGFYNRHG